MRNNRKIAFAASECQPFFTSGGLGEVVGSLPKRIISMSNKGYDLTVYLPLYSKISKDYANKIEFVTKFDVNLSWRRQYCGVYKYQLNGVKYYFIDNEYYFKRDNYYGYFDDAERFAFFSKAVIEVMLKLKEIPDIIHCHDWQTGLIPVYLRTIYYHNESFYKTKRIFTIHNIEYQGNYSQNNDFIEDVFGIDKHDTYLLEFNGNLNIMKGAIECSNIVSTVSPTYAKEIMTKEYGHGLEDIIIKANNEHKLLGILNGIDINFYNPKTDKNIPFNYDDTMLENKTKCKESLIEELKIGNINIPLIGMVTRLVSHKGLDILKEGIIDILNQDVSIVILGTGDASYEEFFKDIENKYHDKVRVILDFNQSLARKIYAASDIFLMPSKAEPCGLSQMIASRYGSIPLVRATGGLFDSIIDFSKDDGNGYVFSGIESKNLCAKLNQALEDYHNKNWNEKVIKVMNVDFSWDKSALKYIEMYKQVLKQK